MYSSCRTCLLDEDAAFQQDHTISFFLLFTRAPQESREREFYHMPINFNFNVYERAYYDIPLFFVLNVNYTHGLILPLPLLFVVVVVFIVFVTTVHNESSIWPMTCWGSCLVWLGRLEDSPALPWLAVSVFTGS